MKENKAIRIGKQFHKDFFEGGMEQAKQNLIKQNKMNTQANNKLIAQFMGCGLAFPPDPDETNQTYVFKDKTHGLYFTNNIHGEYHTSWDWLMPVVRRCHSLGIGHVNIYEADIDDVYKEVVEFIKQYNEK